MGNESGYSSRVEPEIFQDEKQSFTKDESVLISDRSGIDQFYLYRRKKKPSISGEDIFNKLSDEMILSILKWLPKKCLVWITTCNHVFTNNTDNPKISSSHEKNGISIKIFYFSYYKKKKKITVDLLHLRVSPQNCYIICRGWNFENPSLLYLINFDHQGVYRFAGMREITQGRMHVCLTGD